MPHSRAGDFAFGAAAAIAVVKFIVTYSGDMPHTWLPLGPAAVVTVAISRVLRRWKLLLRGVGARCECDHAFSLREGWK